MFVMPLCASVYLCLVATCWERVDLFALSCGVLLWVCYFPIGILGQVWYLIVSIPDLCTLTLILLIKGLDVVSDFIINFLHQTEIQLLVIKLT